MGGGAELPKHPTPPLPPKIIIMERKRDRKGREREKERGKHYNIHLINLILAENYRLQTITPQCH